LQQQPSTVRQVGLHCIPVFAQQVEQSAHLPLGLLGVPACLDGAEGSTKARILTRACWNLWKKLSAKEVVSNVPEGSGRFNESMRAHSGVLDPVIDAFSLGASKGGGV
jgi:hypothetical protein